MNKEIEIAPSVSIWVRTKMVVSECRMTFKEAGFKGVVSRYGWKFFAIFFVYYLVRDVTLYLVLPYLIARGLLG